MRLARSRFWLRMLKRGPLRHVMHYWWNGSRLNSDYEPFASSCPCCCVLCEYAQETPSSEAVCDAS